jgi:hypothetical protein
MGLKGYRLWLWVNLIQLDLQSPNKCPNRWTDIFDQTGIPSETIVVGRCTLNQVDP